MKSTLFFVVKYKTEKNTNVHYVGIIQKENETGSDEVKFMIKSGTNLFVFSNKDDIENGYQRRCGQIATTSFC